MLGDPMVYLGQHPGAAFCSTCLTLLPAGRQGGGGVGAAHPLVPEDHLTFEDD